MARVWGRQGALRPFWHQGLKGAVAIAALVVPLAVLSTPAARAAERLGSAVGVVPAATGRLGGQSTKILTGADLYQGQIISTSSRGQVEILFTDSTRMVVGPSSKLVLETYLMRNSTSVSSFAVKALGGSFRFVTGKSAKDAYKIKTPTGTIGVRGTAFDISVSRFSGKTDVALFHGKVRLCPNAGECIVLSRRCTFGAIPRRTKAEEIDPAKKAFNISRRNFPYVVSQASLRYDFRVRGAEKCKPTTVTASRKKIFTSYEQPAKPPAPPPTQPPSPPPPPPTPDPGHPNKGVGNGGESDDGGGTQETKNPHNSHAWQNFVPPGPPAGKANGRTKN